MNKVKNELSKVLNEIEKNRKSIQNLNLKNYDEQKKIRIVRKKKSFQYYLTENGNNGFSETNPLIQADAEKTFNKNGSYVSKSNIEVVRKIAMKQFYERVLSESGKQEAIIKKFLSEYKDDFFENLYESLHDGRKALFEPVWETKKQFIKKWQEEVYQSSMNENDLIFETSFGLKVRSKSELMIAENLHREGFFFHYEKPLKLNNNCSFSPDFCFLSTLTLQEIFWEHFGMMDDSEYCEKAVRKINTYAEAGYSVEQGNMIYTFETKNYPLLTRIIMNKINFLKENCCS